MSKFQVHDFVLASYNANGAWHMIAVEAIVTGSSVPHLVVGWPRQCMADVMQSQALTYIHGGWLWMATLTWEVVEIS